MIITFLRKREVPKKIKTELVKKSGSINNQIQQCIMVIDGKIKIRINGMEMRFLKKIESKKKERTENEIKHSDKTSRQNKLTKTFWKGNLDGSGACVECWLKDLQSECLKREIKEKQEGKSKSYMDKWNQKIRS